MKCKNCGKAIYAGVWHDMAGEMHKYYVHLQTNRDLCLLPGMTDYYAEKS